MTLISLRATPRPQPKRWYGLAALVSVMALLISSCGAGATQGSSDALSVTIPVGDPSLSVGTAPYTSLPLTLGYYKQEGLNATIQPVSGGTKAVQQISAGNGFATITGMTSFYPSLQRDPSMTIPAVWNNIYRIAVPADSPIKSLKQLKGKTIGVQSLAASSYAYARAQVAAAGLDPETDVSWLPIGIGTQAAAAFQGGKVAAYAGYDTINTTLGNVLNKDMRIVPSSLNNLDAMLGTIVRNETYKKHRDAVEGYLRAIYKSVLFAKTNPEAAIRIHWQKFPETKPGNIGEDEALREAKAVLQARLPVFSPNEQEIYGFAKTASIRKSAKFLLEAGLLEEAINAPKFVDVSLAQESSDFDRQKVMKRAKNWSA